MQKKDMDTLEAFKAYTKSTKVEKMPNTANDYEDEVDADVEAVIQYFKSDIFKMARKKIY